MHQSFHSHPVSLEPEEGEGGGGARQKEYAPEYLTYLKTIRKLNLELPDDLVQDMPTLGIHL